MLHGSAYSITVYYHSQSMFIHLTQINHQVNICNKFPTILFYPILMYNCKNIYKYKGL